MAEDLKGYWISRLLLERGLGVLCFIAFVCALNQFRPLLGEHGLEPVPAFVKQVPFRSSPSLFYLFPADSAFAAGAWAGILLSLAVVTGLSSRYNAWLSMAVWALIYLLYLSFVNVGQTFYGFGWESILLEGCFFAMFLGSSNLVPHQVPIWLFRWLLFRIMFGAGLIKIRGDACWRDLTCLNYYFETQPMPNPLSWYFHWHPEWVHKAGVAFNHLAELIVPFGYFLPQPIAGIAGVITILFQLSIIVSGNLSWLNWLTLVLAFSTIDGKFLSTFHGLASPSLALPPRAFVFANYGVAAIIALLSIPPLLNMLSAGQIMNTNFNPFHLAGTYGAFGSVTRPRYEVVVEATDETVPLPSTQWREYEFKGKPTGLARLPAQIAPYHLRLDWLMWFAAMGSYEQNPWFVIFLERLLEGDPGILGLLANNPFPHRPPRYVRAELYEYHFTTPQEHKATGDWWKRSRVGLYFPAVSLQDQQFKRLLRELGQ